MTRAQYQAKYGAPPPLSTTTPAQNPSLLDRATSVAEKLPGAKLGEALGTSLYSAGKAVKQVATGDFSGAYKTAEDQARENDSHAKEIIGDTVSAVATPLSLAAGPEGAGLAARAGRVGINALGGAVTGAASAAANGGSLGDIAKAGLYGVAAGAGLTGAAEGLSIIPGKIAAAKTARVGAAVDSLEQTYNDLAGTTSKTRKLLNKNQIATEAKNAAGTTGKTATRTLAENGIIPAQSGSKLTTIDQAAKFRKQTQPLHDALTDAIKSIQYSTPPVSVNALESSAISRVASQNIPEGDKLSLLKGIKSEFGLLRDKYGESMTIGEMDSKKPAYWGGTKFDSTKPFQGDAYYQVGKSLQKGIEDAATKAGFDDVAQLNREVGDRLEAAKFLEGMDGKTVANGLLGKHFIRLAGTVAGATHGPLGAILGGVGGDAVANVLINNAVAGPTKRLILKKLEVENPAVYTKTIKWLAAHNALQDTVPRLPAATPAPKLGEPGNPIISGRDIPAPKDTSGDIGSGPAKAYSYRPKNNKGRFGKYYTSETAG